MTPIDNFNSIQATILQVWESYFTSATHIKPSKEYALIKLGEEFWECMEAALTIRKDCKPKKWLSEEDGKEHLAEELSDLIGTAILVAGQYDINLQDALEKKWYSKLS